MTKLDKVKETDYIFAHIEEKNAALQAELETKIKRTRGLMMDKFSKLHEEHLQLEGLVGPGEQDQTLIGYV